MANVNMQYILWGQKREYERWLADVKSGFRALESVGQLERQVADLRREIRGAVQGVDKTLYRYYKYELQQRWLNYYEDKLVNKLEEAIGKAAPGCLTVIVMPEAVIRDYVMEDETKENSFRGRNYVNPLYEETVRKFLGPSISGGEVGDRFISAIKRFCSLLQIMNRRFFLRERSGGNNGVGTTRMESSLTAPLFSIGEGAVLCGISSSSLTLTVW